MLKDILGKYWERLNINDLLNQHQKIVSAIKGKDPDLAEMRMREHLDYVQDRVKEIAFQERQ